MREYDSIPRPQTETHYHIRELIETQEKRAKDRIYHQDRIKSQEERSKEINRAKGKETVMFYCSQCKKDFVGEAFKHVEEDWTNIGKQFASYKTKCICGKWAARFIIDKTHDPYFFRSKFIARQRQDHHSELLQSFESNYNLMYGKS